MTEVQEGMLENVDAPMGTPDPATTVGSPHGGEDAESTKEVGENAGQPPKRELAESSVPEEDSVPTKKLKEDLSERIPALLAKVEEGFSLTGEALQSVKQHLELHPQVATDLQNLASEYHQDRTSAKYSLAQIQSLIEKMSNLDWQVSGPKNEQHTALKSVCTKILTQVSGMHTCLKQVAQELKTANEEAKGSNQAVIDSLNQGLNAMAQSLTGVNRFDPPAPPSAPPAAPLAASTMGQPMTAMYGTPGYSSGYPMPSAPVTPAMPPGSNMTSAPTTPAMPPGPSMPSGPPVGMGTPSGSMGSAPMAEQPTRPLVLTVKDEAGQARRAAVSPTRHTPGSQLPGAYLNEFGLGCVSHGGFFHRRLPDAFLPKGI